VEALVLVGLLLCIAAGAAAALIARRSAGFAVRPRDVALPARLFVVAVAFVAAAALFLNAVRFVLHDIGSWAWWAVPFFWYPVLALVLPLVVAFAVPPDVRSGLRIGWVAAAVPFHLVFFATAVRVDSTNYTYAGLVAYAVLLPVLIAATFWRPAPRPTPPAEGADGQGGERAEE
jgi:hypothetical protein